MTLIWNGDLSKPWAEQHGGCEYGGTFDNTPPLSAQLQQAETIDGYQARAPGRTMLKFTVKPGAQYGSSSGERCLLRQYELDSSRPARTQGFAAAFAMSVLFPTQWPFNSNLDLWQMVEWHGSAGPPACIGLRPNTGGVNLEVKGGPVTAWTPSGPDEVAKVAPKGVWHDFIIDYLLHPTSGKVHVYHRVPSVDADFERTAQFDNRPTIYTGQNLYVLLGLYGPPASYDRWIYHGGAREYSTLAEAMTYMNSLPAAGAPTPEPEPTPEPDPVPVPEPGPVDPMLIISRVEDLEAQLEYLWLSQVKTAERFPKSQPWQWLAARLGLFGQPVQAKALDLDPLDELDEG